MSSHYNATSNEEPANYAIESIRSKNHLNLKKYLGKVNKYGIVSANGRR